MFERTFSWSRTLVVLLAAVLAACGPAASSGAPVPPAGSAAPSPAAGATQAPVLPAGAAADPRDHVLGGPRKRPDGRRGARREQGRRRPPRVLPQRRGHPELSPRGPRGRHADGADVRRPGPAERRGLARLPGPVRLHRDRGRGDDHRPGRNGGTDHRAVDPAAGAALPAPPPARPASAMTVLAEARMAAYPMEVESFGVVTIDVRYTGRSRDPWYRHVRLDDESCVPGQGINCDARLMTMGHDGTSTLVALVRTWVRLPDDPKEPGVVWRTEADCHDFMSAWERSLSWSGWVQATAAGLMGAATLLGYSNPALGVTIFLVGVNLKVLRAGTETFLPKDCWLAPNLLDIRTAALNKAAGSTATIQVTATGDCATAKTAGMRVKGSKRRELTLQPLLPNNQSRFDQPGSGSELYYLPQMATLTVDAADCAREMTGKIDLKPSTPPPRPWPPSRNSSPRTAPRSPSPRSTTTRTSEPRSQARSG